MNFKEFLSRNVGVKNQRREFARQNFSKKKGKCIHIGVHPSGQNRQKSSPYECIFVNSALKIQCHIVRTI